MAIRAWVIGRWTQATHDGIVWGESSFGAAVPYAEDLAFGPSIPPSINVGAWRVDNLANKAALDALDATPGVIVLSAINDDGTKVPGYLRPQDSPTGPQLVAARNRLQAAGVPLGELTARVQVGMTMAQIADTMRDYAHDLRKDAQAAQAKQVGG